MKKIIIYLMIWLLSVLFILNPVQASSSDLLLNHLDFQAQINPEGSMNVTEKWHIEINDTNTLYKTFHTDKTKYSNITNVQVTDITNGINQPFRKSNQWSYHLPQGNFYGGMNQDRQFEIAWGVGLENRSATKTYYISYQVKDAIAKYSDYAELYWQFVGEDFEVDAKNITGTILLPSKVNDLNNIKVWGHTEDLNGEIYATDTNKIEFKVNQFRAGRYVEIRTLFPTEMINNTTRGENVPRLEQVIQEETTWANQANARRKMKQTIQTIITIVLDVLAVILTIVCLKSILKNIRKIKQSKKLLPSEEIQYFRQMPREDATPAEALSLLSKQVGVINNSIFLGRIFSATLLDLNLKKIIDFEVKDKIITIQILDENPKILEDLKDEKVIFEFLKKASEKRNGKITNQELVKYIKKSQSKVLALSVKINEMTEQFLYQKGFANKKEKENKTKITTYIILLVIAIFFMIFTFSILIGLSIKVMGMIPLLITSILQLIVFCILSSKINVLTQEGTDEKAKWKGLKKYMEEFSMLDKREIPEIVIWEKFLVYATVFGIADQVLKQLKIVYPNMNEEFNTNHYGYMYLIMNTNFSSSFSNAITSSMSTAYSSATGGGGGFSGGGGGRTADGGGGGGR